MTSRKLEQQQSRCRLIVRELEGEFPEAETALIHRNSFELLIATILSAQCTDDRVNKVTPELFQLAPDPAALSKLPLKKIEKLIGSVNYFRTKSKNLKACAEMLVTDFGAQVPSTRDELVKLPGVGRKTANVVLGNAFGQPSVVVDTHVKRLSHRLKLSSGNTPEEIEAELERVVDKSKWISISHLLILHGRKTCKALKPLCGACVIRHLCPSQLNKELSL